MTKHPKVEVNEIAIKTTCKLLNKSDITDIIANTFSKDDLIYAIVSVWNLKNFNTNDRIEKHFHNKVFKKDLDGQD